MCSPHLAARGPWNRVRYAIHVFFNIIECVLLTLLLEGLGIALGMPVSGGLLCQYTRGLVPIY
jgi:hypothetical protein